MARSLLHRWSHARIGFWVLGLLMLLKAAMPLLATLAAHARSLPLVEVCTVYGVRLVVSDERSPDHPAGPEAPVDAAAHVDKSCALTPLLASAALPTAATLPHWPARAQTPAAHPRTPAGIPADASRRWLTARLHAPPTSL